MSAPDVIAVGEPLVEWLADGDLDQATATRRSFGGDALNFAVQAARLGLCSAIGTRWSGDPFGRAVRTFAQSEGVQCVGPVDDTRSTGHYWASRRGNRHFAYARAGSASSALAPGDLGVVADWLATSDRSVLFFSGISLAIGPTARDAVLELVRRARRAVFDLNYRPRLLSAREAQEQVHQLSGQLWLLVAGREEAAAVFGGVDEAVETWTRWGLERFVVRGKEGTIGRWAGETSTVEPLRLDLPVMDESGAGDAWDAAFVVGLLEGLPWVDAARMADGVGALVVSRVGCAAVTPRRAELDALGISRAGR